MRPGRHEIIGLLVGALLVAGLLIARSAGIESLQEVALGPWFPIVLVGLYLVRPVLAWPITAISALVGFRYGLVVGLPVALVGAVGTSLIPYAVARRFRPRAGPLGWAADGSERFFAAAGGLRGVIATRLAPTPAEATSAAAGAGGVSLPAFVVGTAIGELPWTVAAVLAGESMRGIASGGPVLDARLAVAGLLLAALLLAGPAYRFVRDRRGTA